MAVRLVLAVMCSISLHLVADDGWTAADGGPVRIGAEARVPESPRSHYSRYVNFRPADGETVHLNPPRMSWPYWPDWPKTFENALHTFTFQIAATRDFARPVVNVTTPYNFYNTIPALHGAKRWYWRVGYDVGTKAEKWSEVRSFVIASDAVEWDRAALAEPGLAARGHPRILFTEDSLEEIRRLRRTDAASRAAFQYMKRRANEILATDWWRNFPKTDREAQPEAQFYTIAHDLALVAFVWLLTEDDKYAGVTERAVTFASYPIGGRSSPEGAGGDAVEDSTQSNEFLALLFDWLYPVLSEQERQVLIKSLEWRIDYWMNSFAWRGKGRGGALVRLTYSTPEDELGSERLYMGPTGEWKHYDWRAPVPEGATSVRVEVFNYYTKGTIWWDSIEIRTAPEGANLLRNADFSQQTAPGKPAEWEFSAYDTAGKPLVAERGGREGTSALGIACASGSDRGSWRQYLSVAGVRELHVTGWYRTEGQQPDAIRATSLSGCCTSHQYEGSMDTAVCGLALYEHGDLGREWFDLMLNYLIGITNGFGFDEAWNEGAGYGTSKAKWLMNATMYFDTALPEANLGRNPYYSRIGDWFSRVIPVGMPHHAWGNQANASRGNHLRHFRKFAYLTGEGRFLLNWQQYGGRKFSTFRPWIEYALPAYYQRPAPEPEKDPVGLFPIAGWGMAASGPPSLRRTYSRGAGIIFQCRPRGGYSHSFYSDNSFQLHAYGQMLNHGGGTSANQDPYADHTMSHNTILVDGQGQAQPRGGQLHPTYGQLVGFSRGEDYVYFAGDATRCYPGEPGIYRQRGLAPPETYEPQDVSHLRRFIRHVLFLRQKYFVIFDDLETSRPARFTWLYHITPEEPFELDPKTVTARYGLEDVRVLLTHVANRDNLTVDDRQGLDGLVNPITGEDYRERRVGDFLCAHNLWISNREPQSQFHFLAVIYPYRGSARAPRITPLDDYTVGVDEDVISFDPATAAQHKADIVVDPQAMRGQGGET